MRISCFGLIDCLRFRVMSPSLGCVVMLLIVCFLLFAVTRKLEAFGIEDERLSVR